MEQAYRDKRAGQKRTGSLITYVCEGVDDVWECDLYVQPAAGQHRGSIQGLSVQGWNNHIGIKRAGRMRTGSLITYVCEGVDDIWECEGV
jgi:hypothetical protein